jgi:Glycosyl transferase family 64 domain
MDSQSSWSDTLHRFRLRSSTAPSPRNTMSNSNLNNDNGFGSSSSSTSNIHSSTKMTTELSGSSNTKLGLHHEVLPLVDNNSDNSIKGHDTNRSDLPRQIIRDARVRWYRWKPLTRYIISFCILPLLVCFLCMEIVDSWFPIYGLPFNDIQDDIHQSLNVANKNGFIVVINTYRRPKQLRKAVRHYAETCGPKAGVQKVFIVWAEDDVIPPTPESFFHKLSRKQQERNRFRNGNIPKRSSVTILPVRNSLNSRFLPIPDVQDMAVFMVDDDIRVDCPSLQLGFTAWKSNPASMVGYYPRLAQMDTSSSLVHVRPTPEKFIYQSWPIVYWRQRINFILTKACFLHSHYMSVYSDPEKHPIEILNYIDQYFNCEDVAMSLLVANVTKSFNTKKIPATPIYVEGHVRDKGLFNGISTGTGHMAKRSECLTDLTAIYVRNGWDIPLDTAFPLRKSSWRHHIPGFWWQARASNMFEWLAVSNIFK